MLDMPSSSLCFGDARVSALVSKAERGQWLASETQGWDEITTIPWWLPGKFYADVISQFYHGELAAIRMCTKLLDTITDPVAQRCVVLQIADEERHAEVYLNYLQGIGPLQPMHPALKAAYEKALSWGDGDGGGGLMMAAFTIILEAEAHYALTYLGRWFRCQKFRRINALVCRDEARHLAFGRFYLKRVFKDCDKQKRMQTYRLLKGLWQDTAMGLLDRFWIPNFLLRRRCRSWVDTGWQDRRKVLMGIGLVSYEEARLADRVAI